MNLLDRILAETPVFFKKIIYLSLTLSAAGAALLGANATVSGFVLPHSIELAAQYAVVAGVVAAAISKTTVVNNTDTKQ